MRARLILENVPHTSFFLASGRDMPDRYRFEAVPGKEHLVQRLISVEELTKEAPDMLCLYGYPDTPVFIQFEAEERDAAGAASGVLDERTKALEAIQRELTALKKDHAQALNVIHDMRGRVEVAEEKGPSITDDQLAQLGLYDQIIEALKPVAGEMETPLDVVLRITHGQGRPDDDKIGSPFPPSDDAKPFDVETRRAELGKLKPAKLKKLAKDVPGAETLTDPADIVEAILMHEAAVTV